MSGESPEPSTSAPGDKPGWRDVFPDDPRAVGREPDYRFSLANERTFLAWIRTSLALVGGGLAVEKFMPEFGGRTALALALMLLGLMLAATSYRKWALNEIALRTEGPLPASRQPLLLAVGVTLTGIVAVVLILLGGR